VDVVNVLRRHRVRFLMPAVKNDRVKEAIEGYDEGCDRGGILLPPSLTRFTMKNAGEQKASFNLLIYRKEDAKAGDPVHKRYIAFATNMSYEEAKAAFDEIPEEYRKRWGIETGFRVQDNVQAKTTSMNYTIRTVYLMLSIFLYNLWVLANAILAYSLDIEPKGPLMKLSYMVKFFTVWIERPGDPHLSRPVGGKGSTPHVDSDGHGRHRRTAPSAGVGGRQDGRMMSITTSPERRTAPERNCVKLGPAKPTCGTTDKELMSIIAVCLTGG
jgi:hypothetical protein